MFWKVGEFIQELWGKQGPFEKILDVGSRNINGSVKDFIPNYKEFVGVDMIPGKDVDIVMNGHDLSKTWLTPYFDLVTCCETFEHDDQFWLTLKEMKKVLKKGGYLVITAPGLNFFQHDYPSDYYRFLPSVFKDVFFKKMEDIHIEEYVSPKPEEIISILGYAKKR